jgi:hypothetical protein
VTRARPVRREHAHVLEDLSRSSFSPSVSSFAFEDETVILQHALVSTIFQKSSQDLVIKILGTSADEFKIKIDKEKVKPNIEKVKD